MLLIKPRRLARSRNTSCRTPFSTTAARASCVLPLIKISVLMNAPAALPVRQARRRQQFSGFEQRQSHHPGVAALKIGDKYGSMSLNGVAPRLVARLAGIPVGMRLGGAYGPEGNQAAAYPRIEAGGRPQGYCGQNFVSSAG